jgi:hypothetical protein
MTWLRSPVAVIADAPGVTMSMTREMACTARNPGVNPNRAAKSCTCHGGAGPHTKRWPTVSARHT